MGARFSVPQVQDERATGSVGCPARSMVRLTTSYGRSDRLGETQRAVAIRALGWRLRVESTHAQSLWFNGSALIAVDLPGQSPLPGQNHWSPDDQELIPTN